MAHERQRLLQAGRSPTARVEPRDVFRNETGDQLSLRSSFFTRNRFVDHEVGFVFGLRKLLGKGAFSNAAGPLEHDGSGSIARFPIEEFIVGRTSEC